eukprot:3251080-Rhodomonas_salina.2
MAPANNRLTLSPATLCCRVLPWSICAEDELCFRLGFAPDTRRTVVGTAGSTWNARERLWQISFKGMARSEKDMGTILAVGGIMPVIEKDEEGHPKVYEVLQVITRRRRDGGRLKWVFRHFSLDQKSQELRVEAQSASNAERAVSNRNAEDEGWIT